MLGLKYKSSACKNICVMFLYKVWENTLPNSNDDNRQGTFLT